MKAWILAAVVAGVLIVVGVPAVALTVASHDSSDHSAASGTRRHGNHRRLGPHWFEKQRQGLRGNGVRPGPRLRPGNGQRPFTLRKLSTKQRHALARRLDERAAQLHKTARCLRKATDASQCLKQFFRPGGFSPRQQQG